MFDLVGFAYVLRVRDSQNVYFWKFQLSICLDSTIVKFCCLQKTLGEADRFTDAKFKSIQKYSIAFQDHI